MTSFVTVPKAQIDKYQTRIQDLEQENTDLRNSKLKLIMSTSKEIERLRQYIHTLTLATQTTKNKTQEMEETEEKSVTICEHCGSASNVNNNYYISISSTGGPGPGGRVSDHPCHDDANDSVHYDEYEEDDGKQVSLDHMSSDDDDQDVDIDVNIDMNVTTPGRVSVIYNGTGPTRGNSVHLTVQDLPHFGDEHSMGEHADIPLPDNFMDDSFVICDHCTSNLPLQFVRKYPDTMQCSKCSAFFEFIFLCNECGKCVCSECYEYQANMQSLDRITHNFSANHVAPEFNAQRLRLCQEQMNEECASTLNKLIAAHHSSLGIKEFSMKLCFMICDFVDDFDLCCMLDTARVGQLFDIYWALSPQKISFQRKFGFADIYLLQSLKWAQTKGKNKVWGIKQVIDNDIMIDNYLSKDYQQITYDVFSEKLAKDANESNTHYEKVWSLLKLVIERENVKHCEELVYDQFAWRELGGAPSMCSKGTYFVWNIPSLQRSYCINVDNRILDKPFGK
eukprot:266006_1